MFAFAAARLALGKAAGALKALPWWVYAIAAGIALLWLGSCYHKREVKAFGDAQYKAGVESEKKANLEAIAKEVARTTAISQQLRNEHEENLRRSAAVADDLRVRGPGRAACPRPAATIPGRHQPASGTTDAAVDTLPDGGGSELIAVPFADFVNLGERFDANRSEVLACRQLYSRIVNP